jgi:hypothetical protein
LFVCAFLTLIIGTKSKNENENEKNGSFVFLILILFLLFIMSVNQMRREERDEIENKE